MPLPGRMITNVARVRVMPAAIAMACALTTSAPSALTRWPDEGAIDADIHIDTRAESLVVMMKYDYVAHGDGEREITLYLNKTYSVRRVSCARCASFTFDPAAQPVASLLIHLREPLDKGSRETFVIQYDGSLRDAYKKDEEFLELGLDDFWFPMHPTFNRFLFRYRANVSVDDPAFQLIANGRVAGGNGHWLVESRDADFDIDIVLGRGLTVAVNDRDGYEVRVVSRNLPDSVPAILLEDITRDLEFYNRTFGATSPQRRVTAVIRPYAPIEGKGGYFRAGYFIIDHTMEPSRYFLTVAHELAHRWWIKADQQNAWLNESFAEYSAMLALRRVRGKAAFDTLLMEKRRNSANLPPIYGFDRTTNRAQAPRVMYVKGPVKLAELERMLGEPRFMDLLSRAVSENIVTTDELVNLVSRVASPQVAAEFLTQLKQ